MEICIDSSKPNEERSFLCPQNVINAISIIGKIIRVNAENNKEPYMPENELKPCPFCGCKDLDIYVIGEDGEVGVVCPCGCCVHVELSFLPNLDNDAHMDNSLFTSTIGIEPLIEKWNSRRAK